MRSSLHACFGRCECICKNDADQRDEALCDSADEKKDLRAGKRISENEKDIFSHQACECCAEHHAEKCRHIGNDGVERKIIRSVFIGQIDIGQGGHDRARCNTEHMLGEANDNIEPDRICRYKGIGVIRGGVQDENDRKRTEPIMPRYQPFPHFREEDEKEEIRRVDTVAERITDADVFQNVSVKRCIGEVKRKGICGGDQDRAEKTLLFKGEREDIGKLCASSLCIGKFFGNEPNKTIDDGKRESDISNDCQHCELVGRARERVADGGNDEGDDVCKGAVDTA